MGKSSQTHTHTYGQLPRKTDDKWIFLITIFRKRGEKRNGNWDNSYTVKEKKNHGHTVQRSNQILCPAWNLSISFWRKKKKKHLPNTIQMLSKTPCGNHHLSWEIFTRETKTLISDRFIRTSVGDVVTYGCESWAIKKSWAPKNWCFWTVVLEKTLENPLDCKEIQPVHPKGDQSWIFIRKTDAKAETPILWPPDAKNWLIWKDPDAGRDWRQEEKGTTEDEMVGWHHWLNGHKFEQTLGGGGGQGGLACCSQWGCKELDTTEQLNWTELSIMDFGIDRMS